MTEMAQAPRRPDGTVRSRIRWFVILLVVLTAAKGVVWAGVVPVFQGPDESSHIAYAEQLERGETVRRTARLDSRALDLALAATMTEEIKHRPQYTGSYDTKTVGAEEDAINQIGHAERTRPGTIATPASSYPPLYYAMLAGVLKLLGGIPYLAAIFGLRLVSVACATAAIGVQYATFRMIFRDEWRAACAALFLTMMPMYSFMQASINLDSIVMLEASLFLYGVIRLRVRGGTWRLHLGLGAVMGLGLLSKPTMLILPVLYTGVVCWNAVKQRERVLSAVGKLATGLILPVTAAVWWFTLKPADGQPFQVTPKPIPFSAHAVSEFLSHLKHMAYPEFLWSFWGIFGWFDATVPTGFARAAGLISIVAAVGLGRYLATRGRRGELSWEPIFVASILLLTAGLLATEYAVVTTLHEGFVQGRYYFPVITAIVGLGILGLSELSRRPVVARILCLATVVGVTVFHAIALIGTVVPRYYL